jgi:hypothetical protein
MVKVMVDGVRGPLQELTLGRLTLAACPPMAGARPPNAGHAAPRPPTNVLLLLCCFAGLLLQLCCFLCKAAGPALRGSSQAPPPSSCDLLLPGLL